MARLSRWLHFRSFWGVGGLNVPDQLIEFECPLAHDRFERKELAHRPLLHEQNYQRLPRKLEESEADPAERDAMTPNPDQLEILLDIALNEEQKFICASVGKSEFGMDGGLLKGPAKKPIPVYKTKVENGKIIVEM